MSVIGVDIGTSSCKGLLLSSGASVVQVARRSDGHRRLISIQGVERDGRGWHLVPREGVVARCSAGVLA